MRRKSTGGGTGTGIGTGTEPGTQTETGTEPKSAQRTQRTQRMRAEVALGRALFDVVRHWRSALGNRLAPHGLSEATWRVLLHIDLLGGRATQAVLAARIGIEAPTMVRLLDRMERDGWVRRTPSAEDRRINWVEPTATGRKVIRKVSSAASDMRSQALAGLTLQDMEHFLAMLARVDARLDAGAASPSAAQAMPARAQRPAPTRRRMRAPRLPRTNSAVL